MEFTAENVANLAIHHPWDFNSHPRARAYARGGDNMGLGVDDFVASEDGLRLAKAFMGTRPALNAALQPS